MKAGTRAIKCNKCGKITGWVIPTGEYNYGIRRVRYSLKEGTVVNDRSFKQTYTCKNCAGN